LSPVHFHGTYAVPRSSDWIALNFIEQASASCTLQLRSQPKGDPFMSATAASVNWATRPAAKSGQFRIGSDLDVSRLGFGTMRLTGKGVWGPPKDRKEAIRVLQRAVELGINFLDTADSYGPYVAEEIIAEALHPYPAGLIIATKAGFDRPGPNKW